VTALLEAELLKLRTTRTFVALAAVTIGTSLLVAGLVAALTEPTEASVVGDVFTADTSTLFILVLAVIGITGEWRHSTITSSLLAAPDRPRFLAAKTLAFAAAGLLLSLLTSLSVALLGLAVLSIRDLPLPEAGDLLAQIAHNGAAAALLGALGVGLGALLRNQPVTIVGVLAASFAVEPVLIELVPAVARFGPFVALPGAVANLRPEDIGFDGAELLSPAVAALLMLAWVSAAYTAAAAQLRRRDVR
jgi:ABC-2 type transport system permease protein